MNETFDIIEWVETNFDQDEVGELLSMAEYFSTVEDDDINTEVN